MSFIDLLHIKDKSVTTTFSVESLRFSQNYLFVICLFYHVTGKLLAVNQHKLQTLVRGNYIKRRF